MARMSLFPEACASAATCSFIFTKTDTRWPITNGALWLEEASVYEIP